MSNMDRNVSTENEIEGITQEEFNAKLEHSYEQSLEGKGRPYEEVFDEVENSLIRLIDDTMNN